MAAAPFGLIVAFDANNVYVHGELYWIYVAVYFTAALVFIWEGVRFGRRNQAAGGNIMALILVFFASGIGMRLCNRQIRADYPCLAFAVMFTYLYYSGVVQNADALTGLRNRRCYRIGGDEFCVIFDGSQDRPGPARSSSAPCWQWSGRSCPACPTWPWA